LGPWFRQLRAITAPEIIRLRFGPVTQQAYAWLQALMGLLYAAVWLWGLSTFVAAVFDFTQVAGLFGASEVQLVIVATGVIVLIYSVSGGSWAVMATDFVQSLILIPLTVLVAFLCLRHIGGVGEMFAQIESQGLTEEFRFIKDPDAFPLGKYGLAFAVATVIYKTIAYSTLITAQKYFGVKDGNEARKAGLLACLLMAGGMLIWFIPPVVARLTMHDEVMATGLSKPAEASYAMIAVALLPKGLTGLIVVAMLAATMSSMDSGLNRNAAVYVKDIDPMLRSALGVPEASERVRFFMGQIVSLVLGVMIIGLALYFSGVDGQGVFEGMLNIGAVIALPMSIPMMLALFIRRAPGWSALASIGATLLPALAGFFAGGELMQGLVEGTALESLLGSEWSYQRKVFVNISIGTAVFLGSIVFWPRMDAAYRAQVDEFFTRMHTPVDFEKEVGQANDGGQLRVIGFFSAVIGGFILLLTLVPGNDLVGRLGIVFVGGTVSGVGGILLYAARRYRQNAEKSAGASPDSPLGNESSGASV
ncbi:MAG: hypothetical protein K8E66_14190, partial [Phycisphaerales bacterium]|nr:hypothetical protein [Phycisphaerales bacterium]